MKKILMIILPFIMASPVYSQQTKPHLSCLTTISDISLPGHTTRYDYQSIDSKRRLLFITHLVDNAVTVFDLKSQSVLKNIADIPSPHGILAGPELGKAFVSATGADKVYVIDERSLTVVGKVEAGHFPDGIAFDPGTKRIFVSDEFGKTVSVIDVATLKLVHKIEIGGVVGNTHYDKISKAIFTADESTNELLKIDPSTLAIVERIKLPGCSGAHGFAIGNDFAYVTGENDASLVVVDLDKKNVVQKFSVGDDPDVLEIDAGLNLLYVSSESGVVAVFKIGTNGLSKLCEGKLWAHAHTVSVDQATHKVYIPLQNLNGTPALKIMLPSMP
jgi:DNA-binding beta-propeller fold protein YncE